jgi:hypothetical protein
MMNDYVAMLAAVAAFISTVIHHYSSDLNVLNSGGRVCHEDSADIQH